jgi:hypothetical protein
MATELRTSFNVPIYPHLKKFILKLYELKEPVKAENYTTLGNLIDLSLFRPADAEHNDQYRDRLTSTIQIELSTRHASRSPRLGKLLRINIYMDRVFKEHLIAHIKAVRLQGIPPYTACRHFLEFYNIEESEYPLATAYMHWQRTQKNQAMK